MKKERMEKMEKDIAVLNAMISIVEKHAKKVSVTHMKYSIDDYDNELGFEYVKTIQFHFDITSDSNASIREIRKEVREMREYAAYIKKAYEISVSFDTNDYQRLPARKCWGAGYVRGYINLNIVKDDYVRNKKSYRFAYDNIFPQKKF